MEMALEFDEDMVVTEDAGETVDRAMRFGGTALLERGSEGTFVAARQANEAGGVLFKFVLEHSAFLFSRSAQLHAGDELAKILVAGTRGNEERQFEIATEARRHGRRSRFLISDCRLKIGGER